MFPLPASTDGPPIWLGGHGPRTLVRTGRLADGWFPTATSAEAFTSGLATVCEAATEAGRDPDTITGAAYLTVVFGDTADAERALSEHSQLYYGVPHEVIATQQGSIAGPPEVVVSWLRGFIDAGATHLCIRIGSRDLRPQFDVLAGLLPELQR